ncbi:FGGY family carbohydrate kinase [Mesorhizobium sp. YR577]|uniref:FGGY family carbohydrate kinase n=1 Tax=Mesorhizobium sp. YR577 TaxID=1884373 RepID=UPI0008F210BC|nr:FGGY family carbohydrate kinase [Mesorhizobium sp. YR577]SFT56386.1 xylulokinase/erythritol kinase [Mesorhizobium sp. YR577]
MLICLDSGTTAVKAAAFDREGRLVATAQRENSALRRDGSRVEQDMLATRDDAFAAIVECAAKAGGKVKALILTGQGDGLWPIGADSLPVGNAITWLDGRARSLASERRRDGSFEAIEAVTFSQPTAASQSLHLLWLQQNDPERLRRISHVLRLKEWLFLCLTGTLKAEPSAVLPVWGDWRTGKLTRTAQETLGLERGIELLPELEEVGQCSAGLAVAVAATLGLPADLPVLLGPGDVQATLIGLGLGTRPGVARASIFGTSAIHARHLLNPLAMPEKPAGAMVQKFVLGEGFLCFHPSFNGATLFRHVANLVGQDGAGSGKPAYSNMVLHPFFEPGGERAPYTSPYASGAAFGLSAATRPEELAWAAREALAFVARKSHDMMGHADGELALGGGLAADPDFGKFLATTMKARVQTMAGAHAGLRGLGAIAAVTLGWANSSEIASLWIGVTDARIEPDIGRVADYAAQKFDIFSRLVDAVSPLWEELGVLGDRATELRKECA